MSATETEPQDVLEEIVPGAEHRVYYVGPEGAQVTLVQRPLSFFQKMDLFAVLGKGVDRAINSGSISLKEIMKESDKSGLGEEEAAKEKEAEDLEMFAQLMLKIVGEAPDLMGDIFVIALGVPRGRREFVKDLIEAPEAQGGLSDEAGFQIIDTFVEQNGEVLRRFFTERLKPLMDKMLARAGEASAQSRPSRATRRRTEKK